MIIKGGSRAGPRQLARHLQRADTNERVQILQLDSPTGSLNEALRDWQLIADGTRGSKGLYHANIDPDARYTMTADQWKIAVDRLEKELGLEGQPRAVVMHEKHGRTHVHVVWQRTDVDTMTMVSDSYNYVAHERASMVLEKEFGHEHVPGKHAKRDREKQPEFPEQKINHAEWQQAERAGIDPREFKEAITALYHHSDSGQAFQAALEERGLIVAKGDRRGHVLVAEDAQVYSLTRQINGVKEKDLRTFMSDVGSLPTVDQAKAMQEERQRALEKAPAENKEAPPPTDPAKEEITKLEAALQARHVEEGLRLRVSQDAEYKATGEVLDRQIAEQLANIDAMQESARDHYAREHIAQPTGISGVVAAMRAAINPERAAEEVQKQMAADAAFLRVQEEDRENLVAVLNTGRERDLADLAERHQQQQREHGARYDEERDRYLREHEAAAKLLAEIEERRQQQQERDLSRDGPDPPDRAR